LTRGQQPLDHQVNCPGDDVALVNLSTFDSKQRILLVKLLDRRVGGAKCWGNDRPLHGWQFGINKMLGLD